MTDERAIKHRRVMEYLTCRNLEAVLLSRRCNFSWYTGGAHNYVATACDVGNSWLLIDGDGARVLTSNIEATRLREEELSETGIEIVALPYADRDAWREAFVKAVGHRPVVCDAPTGFVDLPATDSEFDRLRWALTSWEIDRYRSLCQDVVGAVEGTARSARSGQTENELAGELSSALRARGAVPWVLLVAADDRLEKHRHPLPTDQAVQRCVMLATCAERRGLVVACSRMVAFGAIPADLARKHRAVVTVDTALITSTRVGTTLGEIFAEARQAYAETGFEDQLALHHQGGSCGYLPREVKAGPGESTVVLADQAFAWNPTITGTKSEDTILCRENGPELLAGPTDWPTLNGQWKGQTLARPAILLA